MPVAIKNIAEGSGTGTFAIRMLSRANAGAAAELNVNWARSKGSVLKIPAKPPVKKKSGTPLYESDPTGVTPLNRLMVVAFKTGTVLRIA